MTDLVFYANGRAMKCDGCDAPVGEKDVRFWDKSTKKRFCEKCGRDKGGMVGGSTNTTTHPIQPTTTNNDTTPSHNDAKCDLCGQWYAGREGGMFYNAEHEAYRVCAFCQRVIICQAHAKMAGFWVVAKRPRTEEAKA